MSLININGLSPALMSGAQLNKAKGIEGARSFQTGMNSTVPIFDEDEDVFYIKTTDTFGNITSLRKFNFTEEIQLPPIDNRYATVEQLTEFKEEILDAIKSIQQPANNNGYGSKSYNKPKPNGSNAATQSNG